MWYFGCHLLYEIGTFLVIVTPLISTPGLKAHNMSMKDRIRAGVHPCVYTFKHKYL